MEIPKKRTIKNRLFSGSGWAIFTMFVWETVEKVLENLIILTLSSAMALFIAKMLSTLAVITVTQGTKITIQRFIQPLMQELTYKEGKDKVTKFKKFVSWVNANKCTIGGVCSGVLVAISGSGVIDVNSLPALMINSFNLTPVLYWSLLGLLGIICSFFPEKVEEFLNRINQKKVLKAEKEIEKVARQEMLNEEKIANQTQVEQEKAKQKAEADKLAQEQKAQAEKEYRAKIEAKKAELRAKKTQQ